MVTIHDVNASELIKKTASSLKNEEEIKEPDWAKFVKTGASKERPPVERDWWFTRSASVLRKVYVLGPIGVSKLRKKYGGKKNRGHKPGKFYKGGGNILRKVLQQLEKAELIKYAEKGVHKGRIITPKGKKFLDKIATEIVGVKPKQEGGAPLSTPQASPQQKKNLLEKTSPKKEEKKVEVKEKMAKPEAKVEEVIRKEDGKVQK
jgi:small subunit ribosomal protein S19e